MTNLPATRIPARKERHHLLAIRLGGNVLTILGDIADEEIRMAEHHKVLFASLLLIAQQLLARHIEQLDRHAPGIADTVELWISVAVGQAHRRLPGFTGLAEHTLTQLAR
ncbi:hypothetical protein D3C85_1008290 [compost metagenome]